MVPALTAAAVVTGPTPELIDAIGGLLKKHKVDMYLSGHVRQGGGTVP